MIRLFDKHRLVIIADALAVLDPDDPDTSEIVEQMERIFRDMSERCLGITVLERRPNSSIWEEDPDHPVNDWQHQVANDDTRLGYWSWAAVQKDED